MFQQVRAAWNSRSTVLCQHVIQSFKPDEITPELAHQIGMELAERLLGEEYQFVLATVIHSNSNTPRSTQIRQKTAVPIKVQPLLF